MLCAAAAQCPNALSSVFYNVIWGSRNPVLDEPLLKGLAWAATGGAAGDVAGVSTYLGTELDHGARVPEPVTAAKVQTLSHPGRGRSATRTGAGAHDWWVYGVGPVKVEFLHAGGAPAPVTTAVLQSTNQTPLPPPTDVDYFPFTKGLSLTYRWTNPKHLPQPEVQKFTVDAVANGSGRFTARTSPSRQSGPDPGRRHYGFYEELDGVVNLWGTHESATLLKSRRSARPARPPPSATTSSRLRPDDVRLQPDLPRLPGRRQTWSATKPSLDFTTYGVTGQSR